jgi:CRP/FNR family transcriptional regulator, cyclic AMP receptor protein
MQPTEERLRRCPLFDGFDTGQLRMVAQAGHVKTYAPGRVVFRAGEPGDELYVVLSGEAKVLGKPHARTLGPGDYLGEMALLDGGLRSATIAAVTEVSTLVLSRSVVTELMAEEPRFALVMATVLSWRTRRTERASEAPIGLKFDASGELVD